VNEQSRNIVMGQQIQLKKFRRYLKEICIEKNKAMETYLAKTNGEVLVVPVKLT
jgi:hypothetical protein